MFIIFYAPREIQLQKFVIAKDKKSLANNQANLLLVLGKKLEKNSPDGEYILTKIKQGIDHNQISYHLKIFNTIGLITDLYKPWGYIPLDIRDFPTIKVISVISLTP
jgi:hypothetical protein